MKTIKMLVGLAGGVGTCGLRNGHADAGRRAGQRGDRSSSRRRLQFVDVVETEPSESADETLYVLRNKAAAPERRHAASSARRSMFGVENGNAYRCGSK